MSSTTAVHTQPSNGPDQALPAARWRREKRIGATQLILSAATLTLVLLVYVFKPSVGLGASGVGPGSHLDSESWASVLEEAQSLRMTIVSAEFERVPNAMAQRWATRAEQLAGTIRTIARADETSALGLSTDEVVDRIDELTSIGAGGATTAALVPQLSDLITELELLADNERSARLAQLEEASVSAVRDLGARNLLIAATGLATACALTGLAMGLDRLTTAERHLRTRLDDATAPRRRRVVMDEATLAAS